jgi:galactonate dehydratase
MKVTDVKTRVIDLNYRNAVLVSVETDEGIVGISEVVMKRMTRVVEESILILRPYLLGKDPTEIENHWEKMYRDSFWVGGPLHCTAISAVDCALWDILGKISGLPVYKLLGGPTRRQIATYCHCPAGPTPEVFAENVSRCKARGFHAIKTTLPLFYGAGTPGRGYESVNVSGYSGTNGAIDRSWKETEYLNPAVFPRIREFLVAAREAGGPDMGIAIDCHGRLNPKSAIRLCHILEDLNLLFIEEPVPPENPDEMSLVQRESRIPIAAGERWATIYGVRPFLDVHAVDLLQCDIGNCGGITAMKKIAAMAEAHYVGMAPHNPNGPLATVINVHCAAAIPNFFILETVGSDAEDQVTEELLETPLVRKDGNLCLPSGPGFGVQLNENGVLARLTDKEYAGWR